MFFKSFLSWLGRIPRMLRKRGWLFALSISLAVCTGIPEACALWGSIGTHPSKKLYIRGCCKKLSFSMGGSPTRGACWARVLSRKRASVASGIKILPLVQLWLREERLLRRESQLIGSTNMEALFVIRIRDISVWQVRRFCSCVPLRMGLSFPNWARVIPFPFTTALGTRHTNLV